jgi:hypothetical protein
VKPGLHSRRDYGRELGKTVSRQLNDIRGKNRKIGEDAEPVKQVMTEVYRMVKIDGEKFENIREYSVLKQGNENSQTTKR